MNRAYKHLETRLTIAELTLGQWAGVIGGVALAVGWGMYLSPLGDFPTLLSAIYLGGLPAMTAFLASQTDFDLWLRLRAVARYRQRRDRYLAGGGETALGYLVSPIPTTANGRPPTDRPLELELTALWD